jgi:hypothetical protein
MSVVPLFDYTSFGNAAPEFQAAASTIRQIGARHAIEIGRMLIDLKGKARHGTFQTWVSSELQMTPRTAQNMMAAARFIEGKCASISLLPPTILYKLASPKTDPMIIETVIRDAEAGNAIDTAKIGAKLAVAEDARREGEAFFRRSGKTKCLKVQKLVNQRLDEQAAFLEREEKRRAELRPIIVHLISNLPEMMKVRLRAERNQAWRRDLIDMMIEELGRPDGEGSGR